MFVRSLYVVITVVPYLTEGKEFRFREGKGCGTKHPIHLVNVANTQQMLPCSLQSMQEQDTSSPDPSEYQLKNALVLHFA